jgi:hypothetical protein
MNELTGPPSFFRALARAQPDRFDLHAGIRGAILVLAPLVIGWALGILPEVVLVAVGALNLLFSEAARPQVTRWPLLVVSVGANAAAFAAGTLIALTPFVLEVPLIGASIFLLLGVSRRPDWENSAFISAVMFIFGVGLPPAVQSAIALRPAGVLLGGCFALMGVAIDRFVLFPARSATPHERLTAPETVTPRDRRIHLVAMAVTIALGFVLGMVLGLPRDYWIMLTILVALRIDFAGTLAFSTARILGTVVGAAIAFYVTQLTGDLAVQIVLLGVFLLLCYATRSVNYSFYAVWITLTIIVLLNLVYSGGPGFAVDRILDTIIGGALALLVGVLLAATFSRRPRPIGSMG